MPLYTWSIMRCTSSAHPQVELEECRLRLAEERNTRLKNNSRLVEVQVFTVILLAKWTETFQKEMLIMSLPAAGTGEWAFAQSESIPVWSPSQRLCSRWWTCAGKHRILLPQIPRLPGPAERCWVWLISNRSHILHLLYEFCAFFLLIIIIVNLWRFSLD